MIYLDSSALVKLVRIEQETPDLRHWLADHRHDRATSALARVELVRAVRADGDIAVRTARLLLAELDELPMTSDLLDESAMLPFALRSLDAIHLATAIMLREDLQAFVAYDRRLLAAAKEAGLPIAAPGAS